MQVMRWFGEVDAADTSWKMDVEKVVRQVGLGILRRHKVRMSAYYPDYCFPYSFQNDPISQDEFVAKWNTAVGDTFVSYTSLKLLTVSIMFFKNPSWHSIL